MKVLSFSFLHFHCFLCAFVDGTTGACDDKNYFFFSLSLFLTLTFSLPLPLSSIEGGQVKANVWHKEVIDCNTRTYTLQSMTNFALSSEGERYSGGKFD